MGRDIIETPNPLDFDIPKWWGSADEQGSSRVLEDSDLGAWNITDRDLFDYEVDDMAEKIEEEHRIPPKPWDLEEEEDAELAEGAEEETGAELAEGAEEETECVDVAMADAGDATESAT